MNAITLLKDDHRAVEKLFTRFEAAGPKAYETKRDIVEHIIEALSVHAAIEEQVFYPTIRDQVDGIEDQTLESLEEHHVVKWLLSELEDLPPDDERYVAKTTVLIENVRHHVEEEEQDLFPKVRKVLTTKQLDDLGAALERAKERAPLRPHPRSPDVPPANLVVGPAAALVDKVTERVRDAVTGTVDRVTGAVSSAPDRARTAPAAAKRTATAAKKPATAATKAAERTARPVKKTAAKKTAAKRTAAKKTAARA